MNAAQLHLILNHAPVFGLAFGLLVLLIAFVLKSEVMKRVGFLLFVVTGLLAISVFLTGEPAEEVIEHLPQISETLIENHEEFAEKAVWSVYIVGALSVLGLWLSVKRGQVPKWLCALIVVVSLGAITAMAWTNHLGGKISHPELRDSVPATD